MTAADSGDDSEPGLVRRRGGADAGRAATGPRQRRDMFAGPDDDFEAIRKIIASASLPGAAEEQPAPAQPAPAQPGPPQSSGQPAPARKPVASQQPLSAAATRPHRSRAEGAPGVEGRPGTDSGPTPGNTPAAGIAPAPGPLARGRGRLGADGRSAAGAPPPPPPPDDIILQQRGAGRGSRRTTGYLVAGGILLLLVLAGGGAWYGMQKGLIPLGPASTDDGVPLVTAEKEPMKVTPQDRGGMTIPDQDKQIYERLAGLEDSAQAEERLLPPPELPLVDGPTDGSEEPALAGAPPADASVERPAGPASRAPGDIQVAPLSPAAPAPTAAAGPATGQPAADRPEAGQPQAGQPQAGQPERIEDLLPPAPVDAAAGQDQASDGETPGGVASGGVASGDVTSGDVTSGGVTSGGAAPERAIASPAAPAAGETGMPAAVPGGAAQPEAVASAVPAPPSMAAGVEDITPVAEGEAVASGEDGAAGEAGSPATTSPVPTPPMPSSRPVAQLATPPAAPPPADAILVQLAAVREVAAAQAEWQRLQSRHGAVLSALSPRFQEVDIPDRGRFVRVQAGPFPSREAAAAACATLDSEGQGCFVVRN